MRSLAVDLTSGFGVDSVWIKIVLRLAAASRTGPILELLAATGRDRVEESMVAGEDVWCMHLIEDIGAENLGEIFDGIEGRDCETLRRRTRGPLLEAMMCCMTIVA